MNRMFAFQVKKSAAYLGANDEEIRDMHRFAEERREDISRWNHPRNIPILVILSISIAVMIKYDALYFSVFAFLVVAYQVDMGLKYWYYCNEYVNGRVTGMEYELEEHTAAHITSTDQDDI